MSVSIGSAQVNERSAALRLLFHHLPADECRRRCAVTLAMIDSGELDPAGLFVARSRGDVVGVIIAAVLSGRGAAIWPPVATSVSTADALVVVASEWLRGCGVRVAQALLDTADLSTAAPLLLHGFRHATALWYLRHELELATDWLGRPERLTFTEYVESDAERFGAILVETYDGSLDCPEVSGIRSPIEAIASHQSASANMSQWWLAEWRGDPIGVLLVNAAADGDGWDVAYVGVVPAKRQRGYGRELMRKALFEAKAAGVPWLGLAVDARNVPARALYKSLGFEPIECKEVVLAIWPEGG
ncbi:MAG: GNAT family N-acetyltransferase [Gemmataceae bacterium]